MKKTVQKVCGILWMVLVVGLLAGCGGSKLAASFDEETVKQQAKEDISTAESGDYEKWLGRFQESLQASVTQEAFDSYIAVLEEKGEFQEFGKAAIAGQEQDGKNYAVVVYVVKHEKGDVRYTIAYDEDMKLVSFTI